MKTRTTIRRENLAALVEKHGQAGVADTIGKDRNQVYQWLLDAEDKAARNISDRSAAVIEDAYGKPRGWLDQEHVTIQEPETPYRTASQSAQPDFETMGSAVYLLREYLEIVGDPPEWVADPVMLEIAWWVVEGFGEQVTPNNVIDLTKRLGNRIRGAKGKEGDERSDTESGAAAGAARRRTA